MDDIDYTSVEADYYYAYVTDQGGSGGTGGDPTKPSGPDTGTTDDYNYLVSKYGHIYTERHHTFTSYFKFNWGWRGTGDEAVVNGDALEIISPADSNDKYRMVQMIYYSIE